MNRFARVRRMVLLAVVLAMTALVVPTSTVHEASLALVKVKSAEGVDRGPNVTWVLMLGSDARPGQSVTGSRADAIQLVGINTRTGAGTAIGIPRDSYVNVPGYGRNKINSAMMYGGPQLMARAVAGMVGIRPDYVLVAGFKEFERMINAIGGITVISKFAFSDPVRPRGYKVGKNKLNGLQAHIFSRIRKAFPNGDFDRSANQQRTLMGILKKVRANADKPGFMEKAMFSAARNLHTDLSPSELFTLAHAATQVKPRKFTRCVIQGGTGYVGAASVVFPNIGQARNYAARARKDATLSGC